MKLIISAKRLAQCPSRALCIWRLNGPASNGKIFLWICRFVSVVFSGHLVDGRARWEPKPAGTCWTTADHQEQDSSDNKMAVEKDENESIRLHAKSTPAEHKEDNVDPTSAEQNVDPPPAEHNTAPIAAKHSLDSTSEEHNVPPASQKSLCCGTLKMFLAALCFIYFAKAYSGSYMKSSITQIERRFDLSSSMVGIVDGSFEIGNLLMIAFVSYFGAKLHRPRIIAVGCIVMSLGSFLTAMPHFFMGPYKYESVRTYSASLFSNATESISPCMSNQSSLSPPEMECTKEANNMWVYILIGNVMRGIGETPITPLGISYIDDFAGTENTPLYLAFLNSVGLVGPMVGYTMSSYFAKFYVDVGSVNMDEVTISQQDTRWVGAWWIGFLAAGVLSLLGAIPFFFLPKELKKPEEQNFLTGLVLKESEILEPQKRATVKGFLQALKKLAYNRLYILLIIITLIEVNSFIGSFTYMPKYMEQQYGQSISWANFIIGVCTLPAACTGMFIGGLIMKKFKFGLLSASKMAIIASFVAFLVYGPSFIIGCRNNEFAGITIAYDGNKVETFQESNLFSSCNSDCQCSSSQWDPVCGENNITYMSACLAGCKSSSGTGKDIVFHNCSCMESMGLQWINSTARLGACPRSDKCARMFINFVILQVISTFIYSIGGSASFVIVIWSVSPELKSLAMGIYMLLVRTLAGIPAPIYVGAIIDTTCLKWGTKFCGGQGACRLYDNASFRNNFLAITAAIRVPAFIIFIWYILLVKKRVSKKSLEAAEENGGTTKAYAGDATKEECVALGVEKESCI